MGIHMAVKVAPHFEEVSRVRRDWTPAATRDYIQGLPIWNGEVQVEQKFGGLQNRTYFVTDASGQRFAVRVGFDQYRTRQTAVVQCTIAAHTLGLGPRLVYAEPNLTVTEFVEGEGMQLEQMKDPAIIQRVIERMKILHAGTDAVQETISYWWPFDTVRRYLNAMESGKRANGFQPSRWVGEVARYRDITNRLERAIRPYLPTFTHNDMVFVNMIFNRREEIMFIDWDGGAYGHPMWDLGEMLMWAEADDEMSHFALTCYFGELSDEERQWRLQEIRAFQVMAALRLVTECMETDLDPYFFLTPEEVSISMQLTLPGQKAELAGLVDIVLPRFESLWARYAEEYAP
jgi:thiamine kinase-like enzyme